MPCSGTERDDFSAMQIDNGARDRQAETHASKPMFASKLALIEGQKNSFKSDLFNSNPGIGDLDLERRAGVFTLISVLGANGDATARRSEFDCVAEQIPNDLLKPRRIRDQSTQMCA